MSHDAHFLTRLARLEREHAEIALGLYHDSELVQHILTVADIPADSERVALCLGTPEAGPFLIVARDGGFVTCLGEGMQLREGQPVIPRHRLDKISESLESLRSLVADARAGGRRRTMRKLARVYEAGSGLSQEEFDDLSRWLPLLNVDFLRAHMDRVELCHRLVEHLSRFKKIKRRQDEALHEYWRSSWAVAHLTMLLGSDGGETLRELFTALEEDEVGPPGTFAQLPWTLIRLGVTSFGCRGAWAASKIPTFVVPHAKRRFLSHEATFLTSITDGLSLAAIGLRHRRYQGEVRKTFAKFTTDFGDSATLADIVRGMSGPYFEQHVDNPDLYRDHFIDISRKLLRGVYGHLPEEQLALLDQLPPEIPTALFLSLPQNFHGDPDALRGMFERLPWITGIEARDFYLPEPFVVTMRQPWTREEGMLLYEPRREVGVHRPQPVVRSEPKIGRNAPCPCESGKKYKRCCGAPGQAGPG
jgi:hypothetical protein